jgi:hypothetical protein
MRDTGQKTGRERVKRKTIEEKEILKDKEKQGEGQQ